MKADDIRLLYPNYGFIIKGIREAHEEKPNWTGTFERVRAPHPRLRRSRKKVEIPSGSE